MKRLLLLAAFALAGCATTPGEIDIEVAQCCAPDTYQTFEVRAEDIPAFLGPLIVSNFSVALANRGLQPVNEGGDLVAVLTYEQVDFGRMREKDAFDEPLGMDAERRFIARIAIDVRDAGTGESVFKGHVQRLHDISAGEWMHTGLASQAIFQSFNEVLSEF